MIAVIGDIHGCLFTLKELYNKIRDKYPEIKIYAVGDLVDRGSNSAGVIDFIKEKKIPFTVGNHDLMFSHFFSNPQSVFARSWALNGNESTLHSYDGRENDIKKHIEFINDADFYFDTPDCFISHAGISSRYNKIFTEYISHNLTELEEYIMADYMTEKGVLWTRDKLLNLGKLQIVGHTKQDEVNYNKKSDVLYIDTGACVGNKLTGVIIEKSKLVETISENTHLNDII